MKTLITSIACLTLIAVAASAGAEGFSTAAGYSSAAIYDTTGAPGIIAGLSIDGADLYFNQDTSVMSLSVAGGSAAAVGTIPENVDAPVALRHDGTTFSGNSNSYSAPYPYQMGYIDANGAFQDLLDINGLYDAAVNSQGDCYIVASPQVEETQIFRFNWTDGSLTLVADIGGYSGGLAFDSQDNLYYADQGIFLGRDGGVLKFSAAEVATGGLTVDDAETVLNVTAGFIGFDGDEFYATTGWGAALSKYDLADGTKIEDVAYGNDNSIGKFVFDSEGALYAIDTDWYGYDSRVQKVVPEPATMTFLALGAVMILRRRVRSAS